MRPLSAAGFSVAELHVPNAANTGLLKIGFVAAALTFAIWSTTWLHVSIDAYLDLYPWAHVTLEAVLNALWILLAFGALAHWLMPDKNNTRQLRGFISLVFALSLLFPVISANDDFLQQELINDSKTSQSLVSGLEAKRQFPLQAAPQNMRPLQVFQLVSVRSATFWWIPDWAPGRYNAPAIHASGNHSPPSC
jgi:hypothetical protein